MSDVSYRDTRIVLCCKPNLRRALDDAALRAEEPVSVIVRRAIREYIDRRDRPGPAQAHNQAVHV